METNPNLFNAFDSSKGPKKGTPEGYKEVLDEDVRKAVIRTIDQDQAFEGSDIETFVENGVATLKGVVPSLELKRRAEDVLLGLNGLDHVHNELRVGEIFQEGTGEQARNDGSGNPLLRAGGENPKTHGPASRPTSGHAENAGIEDETQL